MLRGLEIRDMLIIEHLELDFRAGLNVLTGETGAGKSILLDALGFVLGWRGRADLVRQGAEMGEVQAWFDLAEGHKAHDILQEAGLPHSQELILRRQNTKDGRKTAWVNDRRCSGDVLRKLSDSLIELHGQHDDRGILNPRTHRDFLDAFGSYPELLDQTFAAWRQWQTAQKAQAEAENQIAQAREEEEFLRFALSELDALDPQEGEEAALDQARRLMQKSEKIREDIANAARALGSEGAAGRMGDAMRWLEAVAKDAEGQLDAPLAALSKSFAELDEAQTGVAACLDQLRFDPAELERTEERLFAMRGLARKHSVTVDELPQLTQRLRAQLETIDQSDTALAQLQKTTAAAQASYDDFAEKLTEARGKAAFLLDKAMAQELGPLKMERAQFQTTVSAADPSATGCDSVVFEVATNPGTPAGPLAKIASGGELSRFLLALKVCLAGAEPITMIFDEIDRGVGGATADAVGRRLQELAQEGQVLVVTHSPQVAAFGAHHWRVEKTSDLDEARSNVTRLTDTERVDELARMLSGDEVTPEARSAAIALINRP